MNELRIASFLTVLAAASASQAQPQNDRRLSLADAIATAEANVPSLRQARAQSDIARAQANEQRSALLPQLNGTGTYQRTTSNLVQRPSFAGASVMTTPASWSTFNFFNFGLTLSQTLFDAPSFTRWRAALANIGALKATEDAARLDAVYNVRVSFFGARASQALVDVARETLANQKRHLDQVKGFVDVGTRPEIDLAQARTDVANAQVSVITSENNYAVAKAQLTQSMGVERDTEFELGEGDAPPVDIEDANVDEQVQAAAKARPELIAFEERLHAQALAVTASKWAYAPVLGASTGITDAGVDLTNLTWNWNFQAQLQWALFNGLLTQSQVKEMQAQLANITAQRDAQRLQVRIEVERARLAVRAAKATVVAANDALENARLRAKLAEGRYQAGVGNALELGDALLAQANASAQRVQAEYNVASARSQLLRALGRR